MNYITLNNGLKVPAISFGVFRITDMAECEEVVFQAIKAGYRYIDTASAYENEEAVGRAIKRSGIQREELFIATKLWVTDTNYEGAKRGLERSLKRLGLTYVDLFIIHQPYNDYYGAWRAMEEMYKLGKIRAIGIDNFTQERLADFITFNQELPAVNLIEVNPFYQREEDIAFIKEKNIQTVAWSPLGAGNKNIFENEVLVELSNKYNRSIAQIVLRWLYQRNIIPIVKTVNTERMKKNIAIFDFEISNEDMELIAQIDTKHSCFTGRTTGASVEEFLSEAKNYKI